jgi:hypothetical protein
MEVKIKTDQLPAVPTKNPFEAYADGADSSTIIGALLKFSKGDWLVGRDGEECNEKELVAVVTAMLHGWVRWADNRPAEQAMGLLAEGFVPPDRASLGHDDRSRWEVDGAGKPRDPWQLTVYMPMASLDGKSVYTFTTSSDADGRGPSRRFAASTAPASGNIPTSSRSWRSGRTATRIPTVRSAG